VQRCVSFGRLTVGHYKKYAVYRLYFGTSCLCNKATGKNVWLLVTIEFLLFSVCILGLTVIATGNSYGRLSFGHYSNCAVYCLYCGAYC